MKLFRLILAAGSLLSAIHNAGFAANLHVAVGGDDSNPGTFQQPFRSISRAAEQAVPGDTVLVHEGTYRERVAPPRGGRSGQRITYMAAPGERVVVKGSEIWTPTWTELSRGIYSAVPDAAMFDDRREDYVDSHNPLEVELASTPWEREGRREKERGYPGDERIIFTCGQVFINGDRYREVPMRKELEPGSWFYESETKRVYVHFGKLDPAQQVVELTTRRRIFAPTERGLGYITVQGFIMEHCGNQYPTNFWEIEANAQKGALGIEAGHHWVIRRNVIRHAKTFAIDAGYVDRRTRDLTPHDNLIEENYIVDNGSAGILSNKSQRMVIRGNVVLRNNLLRFFELKRWEQAGIKCHNFRDGLIEGNYVADNILTYGIWLDNQFPDSRVSGNVLVNNGRAGIFLEMSDYDYGCLLVDNNVIVGNNENQIYIHDASGALFANNLIAGTEAVGDRGQAIFIRQVTERTRSRHHEFYNNLVLSNSIAVDVNYPSHRSGPQRFDHNLYGCAGHDHAFRINSRSDKPVPWNDQQFTQLVAADVGSSFGAEHVSSRGAVPLRFDQWQQFWNANDESNDQHSILSSGSMADYNKETQTVSIDIAIDPKQLPCRDVERVNEDFFGHARGASSQPIPGPFQSLKLGRNTFEVWKGLPLLATGDLPPVTWNSTNEARPDLEYQTNEIHETSSQLQAAVESPNGKLRLEFSLRNTSAGNHSPTYRVWYEGEPIIAQSGLGLKLAELPDLASGFELIGSEISTIDSIWEPVCGERSKVRDHCRQLVVQLRHQDPPRLGLQLTFRCYDEGIAFRYEVTGGSDSQIKVQAEHSEFAFLENHTTWSTSSGQGKHQQKPLQELKGALERPLTLKSKAGLHLAVAEAAQHDYARMKLRRSAEQETTLESSLAGPVVGNLPLKSPWRVVMVGTSAGQLLENNDLIRNLNEPCELKDTSWIKPGKVLREITLTTEGGLACVDFADKHNIEFVEFDAGWYGHEYDDASDATTISVDPKRSPGPLDLHRVIRYAEDRDIGVILYVNRRALEKQLDEILPLYKSWGVRGVKFGFVNVGSQQWTNWLHEGIRKAAEHQLMVDVHDEYRSTGYDRTYPNLMTVEGIGGDETSPSNRLALMNLFTRMLSGAADHKICYFNERVERDSSHASQLAKAVCFFDPWQFLFWYDTPLPADRQHRSFDIIHETPELEFWDQMPTVWDDTKVIAGQVGEYALIARRSGDEWFVGAMNAGTPRILKLPLDFLPPEVEYTAKVYSDDPQIETRTRVRVDQRDVQHDTTLSVPLRSNGGQAVWLFPSTHEGQ